MRVTPICVWALLFSTTANAQFTDVAIDVTSGQIVTIRGVAPSLKGVIQDLCWHGGVELRGFDAPDRAVTLDYANVPLHELLRRLLRTESYQANVTAGPAGAVVVKSLRVLGDHTEAAKNRQTPVRAESGTGFQVPPALVRSAFQARDPEDRDHALATVMQRILSDEGQLRAFLATDSNIIANNIREFPYAAGMLTSIRDKIPHPEAQAKLDEIVAALER